MNVTNLDSVTFGIADFAACRRFWTDFGLTESAGDLHFADAGEVELKGLSGKRRVYRAIW